MQNSLINTALTEAGKAQKRVERVAQTLADLMQRIHGGTWRIQISHEEGAELVLVACRPRDRGQVTPKPEVA